jgi:D-hexose-6-phosphate mutarotase
VYPHAFTMHFLVRLTEAGHLVTRLEVTNTGADSMPVTCALHTYFATADISQVRPKSLPGCRARFDTAQVSTGIANTHEPRDTKLCCVRCRGVRAFLIIASFYSV